MLALSSKVGYAMTALYELSRTEKGTPLQIRVIAERNGISQHYLEQVLIVLKEQGIVRSLRGAAGGYMLDCRPSEIRVLDIIIALEGPPCLVQKNRPEDPLRDYWVRCENDVKALFSDTLQDLIEEWAPTQPAAEAPAKMPAEAAERPLRAPAP